MLLCVCCQADARLQSAGRQPRLQASAEVVAHHGQQRRSAEPHGTRLGVGRRLRFKPRLGERLAAAQRVADQRGGQPHRAAEHHQRIPRDDPERRSVNRKHIATRRAPRDPSPRAHRAAAGHQDDTETRCGVQRNRSHEHDGALNRRDGCMEDVARRETEHFF